MGFNNWIENAGNYAKENRDAITKNIDGGFKGDFYGFLGNILKNNLSSGLPELDLLRQNSEGAINRGFDKSRTNMKEDLAGRGMGGSGAALAALAGLGGERANALGNNEAQLSQMDTNFRQNSLGQLLGLNAFGGSQDLNANQQLLQMLGINVGDHANAQGIKFESDSRPSGFAQFMGQLLGMGTQLGSSYLMGQGMKG